MKKEIMLALFTLAEIPVKHVDELPNEYWPRDKHYLELREQFPWWLVETEFGVVKIGWRKRVISIEWDRTPIRIVVTADEVTKDDTMVHAWGYPKALEYLVSLRKAANRLSEVAADEKVEAGSQL